MQRGFILALFFAILVTVFAILNAEVAPINFLFVKVEISQALVIFISAAFGAIIVTTLGFFRDIKMKSVMKDLNRKIGSLENEKSILQTEIETLKSKDSDKINFESNDVLEKKDINIDNQL